MGIMDPSYASVVAEAKEHKIESLSNPEGVQYLDHAWGMIMNEDNLSVVLRTDEEVFDDVDVRAWWSHGSYNFSDSEKDELSILNFEVPDEVSRRIQSRHASGVMRKFFGVDSDIELEHPYLGDPKDKNSRDETRSGFKDYPPELSEKEIIINDWDKLKEAIRLSSRYSDHQISGQSLSLISTARGSTAFARVNQDKLELLIPDSAVVAINGLWNKAFKEEISQ